MTRTATIVMSGVVAFQRPARTDGTVRSPSAMSVNGAAFMSSPTTARCRQISRSRGSRSPRAATTASSVAAPSATRPRATSSGGQCSPRTLMKRKLEPQIAASSTNWAGQGGAAVVVRAPVSAARTASKSSTSLRR